MTMVHKECNLKVAS